VENNHSLNPDKTSVMFLLEDSVLFPGTSGTSPVLMYSHRQEAGAGLGSLSQLTRDVQRCFCLEL
jgi:hypothetical protein